MAHQGSPENLESAAHEKDDVSVRGIAHFAIWFVIVAAVVHVLVWVIFKTILHYHEEQYAPVSALFPQEGKQPHPPDPQLQPTQVSHELVPWEDTQLMREREDAEFQRRGWSVDTVMHRATINPATVEQVLALTRSAPPPPAPTTAPYPRTQPPARPLEQIGVDR
jgi:hypothetical protein